MIVRVASRWLVGLLITYAALWGLARRIPYAQEPGYLVTATKRNAARRPGLFQGAKLRVAIFGDSRILSGFIPATFDSALHRAGYASVKSYNFGLPGESAFLADMDGMIADGNAPNLVLLTDAWPASEESMTGGLLFPKNDAKLMAEIFPFRTLATDVVALLVSARLSPPRMLERYRQSEREIRLMEFDRGYHNIGMQIRQFANQQLPDALEVPTDTPDSVAVRLVPAGPIYERLARRLASRGIVCVFVPIYYRESNFAAPPATNQSTKALLDAFPNMGVVGPDYLRFPNAQFADLVHANPAGAHRYTATVAVLVSDWLAEHHWRADQ